VFSELLFLYFFGAYLTNKVVTMGQFKTIKEQRGCLTWIMVWYLPHLTDMTNELNKSNDFFAIFDHQAGIDNFKGQKLEREKLKGVIEFKNVYFNYPTKPAIKILKNINCKINEGESVAFVGGSGSGKSTIINLLMRLYDPNPSQKGEK